MFDQLKVGNILSYDDYEASVKERTITDGKKKTIKDTVPFSNEAYDFSKINGELYWEEKTLQYVFEITADTHKELSVKVVAFKSWIMNIMSGELHDPFIPDYHFIATFSDIAVDDKELEKATITVTFTAYPYMISDIAKQYVFDLANGEERTISIVNNSSHRITPTFNATVPFTVSKGTDSYSVPSGETKDDSFKLDEGTIELVLQSTDDGSVVITFYEEVF